MTCVTHGKRVQVTFVANNASNGHQCQDCQYQLRDTQLTINQAIMNTYCKLWITGLGAYFQMEPFYGDLLSRVGRGLHVLSYGGLFAGGKRLALLDPRVPSGRRLQGLISSYLYPYPPPTVKHVLTRLTLISEMIKFDLSGADFSPRAEKLEPWTRSQ